MALFEHLLVPIASDNDAESTCAALDPYLDSVEQITAIHVIEKGGGSIDKAPLGKRQEDGEAILAAVESRLGESVSVDSTIAYGTDLVEAVFDAAVKAEADAVAFHARGGSRITRLLAGDTTSKLVTDPEVPVVSLPTPRR